MISRRNLFLGSAAIILTPGVLMPVRKVWVPAGVLSLSVGWDGSYYFVNQSDTAVNMGFGGVEVLVQPGEVKTNLSIKNGVAILPAGEFRGVIVSKPGSSRRFDSIKYPARTNFDYTPLRVLS
jgi:hypothetical protein